MTSRPVSRRLIQSFDPARNMPHATGEHLVWGFTGMVLDGLFDRLGWTEPWDPERELPLVLPD